MDAEKYLIRFLSERGIVNVNIKKLAGSSEVATFFYDQKIFKVGRDGDVENQIGVYQWFQDQLTSKEYVKIFPEAKIVNRDDGLAIAQIAFLGNNDFENTVLVLGDLPDNEKGKYLKVLENLNLQVLSKIRLLFDKTRSDNLKEVEAFFTELINALEVNLRKAGWLDTGLIKKIEQLRNELSVYCQISTSSCVHKDLSLGNIVIADDKKEAFFIDPRPVIPHLAGRSSRGSVAVDLTGYLVSLQRKESELQRIDPDFSLKTLIEKVAEEISGYEKKGVFAIRLKELCVLFWHSVYVACKCDYCTAAERLWLYQEMEICLKDGLSRV